MLAVGGCYCSHEPAEEADAGEPVDADDHADAPARDTAPRPPDDAGRPPPPPDCGDPTLWSEEPADEALVRAPLECEEFDEPLHAIDFHFSVRDVTAPTACWRVVEQEYTGLEEGALLSDTPSRGVLLTVRPTSRVVVEARTRIDGRVIAGRGDYAPRPGSTNGRELARPAERPELLVPGGTTLPSDDPPEWYMDGVVAAAHPRLGVFDVVVDAGGTRVLRSVYTDGTVLAERELDAALPVHLDASWTEVTVAVQGSTAYVVTVEGRDDPVGRIEELALGTSPDDVEVVEGGFLTRRGAELGAFSLGGEALETPASPDVASLVSEGARWADGSYSTLSIESGRVVVGDSVELDPRIGELLAVYYGGGGSRLFFGTGGLARPAGSGPAFADAGALYGGAIVTAVVEHYRSTQQILVDQGEEHVTFTLQQSYEGCD